MAQNSSGAKQDSPFNLIVFPQPDSSGVVAVTDFINTDIVYSGYIQGIFPWFNEDEGEAVVWWSPDPRFVLLPENIHVSSRLKRFIRHSPYKYTFDKDFDGVIEGIESGLFNFVAHPDLIMASGRDWSDDLAACFSHVIDAAMAHSLPLEINGLGNCRTAVKSREGIRQPYPYYKFWELVKEKGATVVCNADAHRPQDMAPFVESARSYAKKFGITPIEDIFSV